MASDDAGSICQDNLDNATGFQVKANAGSNVHQAGHDINQFNQAVEGQQNQAIGHVFGGVVLYVSGGQAIINNAPTQEVTSAQTEAEQSRELGPCPYRGLLAYHEKDGEFYFGRTKEIAQLWSDFRALHRDSDKIRLFPIYGPSGSGKSSLARAGVIPKLAQEPLPGKERARVAVMVPGTQPLQALAGILAQIATQDAMAVSKTREFAEELALANKSGVFDGLHRIASLLPEVQTVPLVVVVDQFEEVYSLCKDGEVRDAFIGNLLYAAAEVTQAVSVLVTFRSDFLAETFQHPQLNRLFSEQGFLAPMMDEVALREAIAQPAANAEAALDEGTIQLLIEQTQGREGALPLLQFALTRIWAGMGKGVEPAQTLRVIGGVGGALADSAQRIYDGLSKPEQDIARRFFLGLVQFREGLQDTRRRVPVSRLVAARDEPEHVQRVMGNFASPEARLITLSSEDGGVEFAEVSHEALIQHWGLLRGWIEQNRDLLRKQRKIEASAVAWQDQGEVSGYLLQGAPLAEATQFCKQQNNEFPLSAPARGFVNKSMKYRRWSQIKTASWLIIPALVILGVTDYQLRENSVQVNLARLDQEGTYEEAQAVQFLVSGCFGNHKYQFPKYLAERLFGYCRSLAKAPLYKVELTAADLAFSNFHSANLMSADLSEAILIGTNLSKVILVDADLSEADLSKVNLGDAWLSSATLVGTKIVFANLVEANLSEASILGSDLRSSNLAFADLSKSRLAFTDFSESSFISTNVDGADFQNVKLHNAIALDTDFRSAQNLLQGQFEGKHSPLICNSPLPKAIPIDKDRNCPQIAAALLDRYPQDFENLEAAQTFVDEER